MSGKACQFNVGTRCLVRKYFSKYAHEVVIVEISPSGRMVKFDPGGWEDTGDWVLLEELPSNPVTQEASHGNT